MSRFAQRNVRLARRRESAVFADVIMPFAALVGFVGLLAAFLVLFDHWRHNRWEAEAFVVAVSAAGVPLALLLYRWTRGHFSRDLENH